MIDENPGSMTPKSHRSTAQVIPVTLQQRNARTSSANKEPDVPCVVEVSSASQDLRDGIVAPRLGFNESERISEFSHCLPIPRMIATPNLSVHFVYGFHRSDKAMLCITIRYPNNEKFFPRPRTVGRLFLFAGCPTSFRWDFLCSYWLPPTAPRFVTRLHGAAAVLDTAASRRHALSRRVHTVLRRLGTATICTSTAARDKNTFVT